MERYAIIIEQNETGIGYGAYVPDLPGCIAVADTIEEVIDLIREAIQFHIEELIEENLPVPPPTTRVEYITL